MVDVMVPVDDGGGIGVVVGDTGGGKCAGDPDGGVGGGNGGNGEGEGVVVEQLEQNENAISERVTQNPSLPVVSKSFHPKHIYGFSL